MTAVENKIPDISSLVKKTDYNTKISKIEKKVTVQNHDKYITTPEFNKFTAEIFTARLAQANLVTNVDFDNKLKSLNKKNFEEDGTQNYLVFQPIGRYFKRIIVVGNGEYIYFWKYKGLSDEKNDSITASNYSFTPSLDHLGAKIRVKFNGSCLKQDKITYTHGKIVNIYIVYETSKNCDMCSYPTLENCLFGAVSVTKNADIDQYKYSGYGIGFDRKGTFSFGNGFCRNCIIFGLDMSSSAHVDNKKKDSLILGEGPTQGLDDTTLTAEKKKYSINFTENNQKFCLSLHFNGAKSYLFVNGTEIIKFKAKDS